MLKEFVNKEVEVLVAFSTGFPSGGAVPNVYKGVLIALDEEFIKLRLTRSKAPNDITIIAIKYIITVKEL